MPIEFPPLCEADHLLLIEAAAAEGDFVTFTVDSEAAEQRYTEYLAAQRIHVVERYENSEAGTITVVVRHAPPCFARLGSS